MDPTPLHDEHWPDLALFDTKYCNSFGFGYAAMLAIARVYQQTGRNEKFEQAMGIVRKTHDSDIRSLADNIFLQSAEAAYWALSGDFERALLDLEPLVLDRTI